MKKINLIGFIVIVLVIVVIGGGLFLFFKLNKKPQVVIKNKNILVGFSITTLQEERWQKDKAEFLKEADKMGVSVDLQIAQNDASKQISQIDSMIVNGEDIIVVVPYKADALTDVIDRAHKAGIKVISYDRLIQNANTDLYVSFDNEKVGEYQAQYVMDAVKDKMDQGNKIKVAYVGGSPTDNNSSLLKQGSFKVLQPLIDSGKIQMVSDSFTVDWNPDNAYKNMKDYLSKNKAQVDAVVAANDGTAFGVISALKEYGLDGKIPVSGQDAELAAIQRIIDKTQTVSVYKPISKLASTAVDLAINLVEGIPVKMTKTINDGKFEIPAVLLDPVAVTLANIDATVIKDGFYTKDQVYKKN